MTGTPFPVSGTITDMNASSLEGATVYVYDLNNQEGRQATTNSSGQYSVDLANMVNDYEDGDRIIIEAFKTNPYRYARHEFILSTTDGSFVVEFKGGFKAPIVWNVDENGGLVPINKVDDHIEEITVLVR